MKMIDTFPKVFQVNGNPSFDVQDCKYIAYGEGFRTTAQEDSAIAEAVLSHDKLTERVKELEELLSQSRDFVSADKNCGPCGLGLICMIDDALEKE